MNYKDHKETIDKCTSLLNGFFKEKREDLKVETPVMGSLLETQIALYCFGKKADFAIDNNNLNLTNYMEKALEMYSLTDHTIELGNNQKVQLSSVSGQHSEFRIYYLRNK